MARAGKGDEIYKEKDMNCWLGGWWVVVAKTRVKG